MAASDWTRDAAGEFVDWTKAPYQVGGVVRLVLEGEDPDRIPSNVRDRRMREFYLLTWRRMGMKGPPKPKRRNLTAETSDGLTARQRARAQVGLPID